MSTQRKTDKRKATWPHPVRLHTIESKDGVPELARMIINYYQNKNKESGRGVAGFSIQAMPLSLNHQYDEVIHRVKVRRKDGSSGIIHRPGRKLKDEVKAWRDLVHLSVGHHRFNFKVTGPIAVVILFQSPRWVTKELKVRQVDSDNFIKPLLDAVEKALDTPDELAWNEHVFKVLGPKERTLVYLFDLGDIVEYHKF